jgi:hypothetical protein
MAWGYLLLVIIGLVMVGVGFYGAFIYKNQNIYKNILALLMPVGLLIAIVGIILTVLPDFFKETVW